MLFLLFFGIVMVRIAIDIKNDPHAGMSKSEKLFGVDAHLSLLANDSSSSWGGGMDYSTFSVFALPENVGERFESWTTDGHDAAAAIATFPVLPSHRQDHTLYTWQASPLPEELQAHLDYAISLRSPHMYAVREALRKEGSYFAIYSKRTNSGIFSHIEFFVVDVENQRFYEFGGSI